MVKKGGISSKTASLLSTTITTLSTEEGLAKVIRLLRAKPERIPKCISMIEAGLLEEKPVLGEAKPVKFPKSAI
eukprot:7200595-Lingulodinium_polyedra.AAC.1